jgi:alpha-L-fucosidase
MNFPMPPSLTRLAVACAALVGAHAAFAETIPPEDRTRWFREARFGLFIHWGVYAVPAGEWQGKQIGGIGEWIMRLR